MTANDLRVWHSIFQRATNEGVKGESTGGLTAAMVCLLIRDAIAEEIKVLDKEEWKNNT